MKRGLGSQCHQTSLVAVALAAVTIFGVLLSACAPQKSGEMSALPAAPDQAGSARIPKTPYTLQGTVDGGGGKGILCGTHLRTLDLYEAEEVHGFKISTSLATLNENLDFFGARLFQHLSDAQLPATFPGANQLFQKDVIERFHRIERGTRLGYTDDARLPRLPPDCHPVQIAIYEKDGTIQVDPEYLEMLNVQNETSLVMHEWVYARARQYGIKTSDETRYVIGMLLSEKQAEPLFSPIWQATKKLWVGGGAGDDGGEIFELYVVDEVRDGKSGAGFYFRAFKGIYVTSRVSGFAPGIAANEFKLGRLPMMTVEMTSKVLNKRWKFEIKPTANDHSPDFRAYAKGETPPPFSHSLTRDE